MVKNPTYGKEWSSCRDGHSRTRHIESFLAIYGSGRGPALLGGVLFLFLPRFRQQASEQCHEIDCSAHLVFYYTECAHRDHAQLSATFV